MEQIVINSYFQSKKIIIPSSKKIQNEIIQKISKTMKFADENKLIIEEINKKNSRLINSVINFELENKLI